MTIKLYKILIKSHKTLLREEGLEGPIRETLKKMEDILRKGSLMSKMTNSLTVIDEIRMRQLMIRLHYL